MSISVLSELKEYCEVPDSSDPDDVGPLLHDEILADPKFCFGSRIPDLALRRYLMGYKKRASQLTNKSLKKHRANRRNF